MPGGRFRSQLNSAMVSIAYKRQILESGVRVETLQIAVSVSITDEAVGCIARTALAAR